VVGGGFGGSTIHHHEVGCKGEFLEELEKLKELEKEIISSLIP